METILFGGGFFVLAACGYRWTRRSSDLVSALATIAFTVLVRLSAFLLPVDLFILNLRDTYRAQLQADALPHFEAQQFLDGHMSLAPGSDLAEYALLPDSPAQSGTVFVFTFIIWLFLVWFATGLYANLVAQLVSPYFVYSRRARLSPRYCIPAALLGIAYMWYPAISDYLDVATVISNKSLVAKHLYEEDGCPKSLSAPEGYCQLLASAITSPREHFFGGHLLWRAIKKTIEEAKDEQRLSSAILIGGVVLHLAFIMHL
ncbi:uncharacterized protein RHOBADRAFT_55884 [Rhodotorula graminis WP1]|uniref:Uncharacterized protein n=1 Tax=Rhodotorula graminis (strain WP1) TaxID=578459 RepID=A0A0P9EYW7_RHOGW|nr:uncharacterized protein RHOBADRAFT_55884 [Rhodotorula graminis WP1]KPV72417.1 hypothetical protein RHOBADRAFT_55884 [Rhodotorula graminis WP1]